MSTSSSTHEHSPEPVYAQHSQTHAAARRISTAGALSPGLRLCANPRATADGGGGDPSSDHSALSQSAPTSPFINRLSTNGSVKTPSFLLIPHYHQNVPSSAQHNLPRTASPAPATSPGIPDSTVEGDPRARTGSIGGGVPRIGRDTRPPAFADHLLRFPHQRTLSVQSSVSGYNGGSGSPTSGGMLGTAAAAAMHVPSGLERASSSGSSSHRQSRRCSVAVSTNLSITQGLPVDPDQLDMDDGDESDGYQSCGINSAHSDSDFEADDDSMELDGINDAVSIGQQSSLVSAARRKSRQSIAHEVGSAGSTPRNKAFERLRSLVEEDKQALASEMEHEGQITRTIRHNSVQEWLRRSSSAGLSSSPGIPPAIGMPLLQNGCSPRAAADDTSSTSTMSALRGGPAAKLARPVPVRTPGALQQHQQQGGGGGGDVHDIMGVPFPPESPISSLTSSPSLATTLHAAGATAAASAAGMSTIVYPPQNTAGSSTLCTTPTNKKRKATDDDGGAASGNNSSGDATTDEPTTPHSYHHYKRQAMSPSGLRVQVGMGSGANSSRRVILAPTKSGPSSPLLGPVPRPIAMPAGSRHYPQQQQSLNGAPGTLPSMAGVVVNHPMPQNSVFGGAKSPINRVRSRSGATPLGALGGYYGSSSSSGGSANIMQANGVFSRMNISDKKQNNSQPQ
ncbi:hypothetical protein IW140_001856 [Coemansia sp. RSA 1813]|nr:hypothetical protein EV178_002512 [Coemansia sp. RSA 1646]KAJ1772404.1 hypothetical protein LPJ74_001494 [Coemansia sp. RSA 1843]KAJ2091126.1 hypothetical protein IW138_002088 [Coemansia sp. RSA 986]KAJ2213621.1 hypothetical protein EV179_003737 [Coemansia sp. RSA 487]KAJ2571153.1 hypothetical protein IW140_001856 [Coemansia sp. RSA 1813]